MKTAKQGRPDRFVKLAGSIDDKLAEIQTAAPDALAWMMAPPDRATARAALGLVIDYTALVHVAKLGARDRRALARSVGELLGRLPEFIKAARAGQRFEFVVRMRDGRRPLTTFANELNAVQS